MVWGILAICSGIVCFYVPFYIYGYGVASQSGKTEDLFSIYFASYQANVLSHHVQMFITIRHYSGFFGLTSTVSMAVLWPFTLVLCQYELLPSEMLYRHYGTLFWDELFMQASSVLLTTFFIILPIYVFKVVKMRLLYPEFFPTN
mmetsp:Transcript_38763/g.50753  ORF Transcript_38763/g.50753 Transcript_38763/m.50753 type:complete len:145 (+) Transcript_38763:1430-1864(+)